MRSVHIEKEVKFVGVKEIGKKRLYFDGAMGKMLQKSGLKLGEVPEVFNFTHEALMEEIHRTYLEAGADFVTTNTFGANRYKVEEMGYSVADVIGQAVKVARRATDDFGHGAIVLDVGPTGKMLQPLGDVSFEEAYDVFKEQVVAGEVAGCDAILFETFTDLYELKAGILAAKENTSLPIFCTMSFEANGRTFFGTSIEAMVLTLEALGVNMLGINCSLGPKELVPIVEKLVSVATLPVMVQPNAGLPTMENGETKFNITSDEFADYMKYFAEIGVNVLGGCCGTEPAYIQKVRVLTAAMPYEAPHNAKRAGICSATQAVYFDDVRLIGERLNPTVKKLLKVAINKGDMDFVLRESSAQIENGADF